MVGARWQRAAAAVLVSLGAAACATSPGPTKNSSVALVPPIPSTTTTMPPVAAPPAVVAAPTTTRPPTTTTTVPPTTTTVILGPSGCPISSLSGTGLPANAFDVTQATLDAEGGGKTDHIYVYAVPSPQGAPFRLRLVLSTGYTVETQLSSVGPVSAQAAAAEGDPIATALGGFDVAGRGHEMAFVQVDRVGAEATDALYDFSGCGMLPVTDATRHTMDLVVGGNSSRYDAFGCGRDANTHVPFVQTESAVSIDDGANYNLTTTIFDFTKDQLIQSQTESTTYTPPAGASTSAPPQMTTLECGQWGSVGSPNTPPSTTTTTTTTAAGPTTTSSSSSTTSTTR
ncbi:MAG TPA: hypothetical protein VFW24_09440 [Acidimicrobiales bacterium]|nr:hypothetical protein [Acidimicrobiales bacterium]